MNVAKQLWRRLEPDDKESTAGHKIVRRFSGELVKPLLNKFEGLRYSASKDVLPLLITMMEAVRAIPYTASAHGPVDGEAMQAAFRHFLAADPLDALIDPELSRTQGAMVEQGWGLLCFRVLGMHELPSVHLPAIRLLLAMTGGASSETQDALLYQLQDLSKCPNELCCSVFRQMLRWSLDDLKTWKRAVRDSDGIGIDKIKIQERGYAEEVLQVMSNLSQSIVGAPHQGFQIYLETQPSHVQEINMITEIVGFVSHIEGTVSLAMKRFDDQTVRTNEKSADRSMLRRCLTAFKTLIALTTGPQPENQRALGGTVVAAVANRLFRNAQYQYEDLDGNSSNTRPRRRMTGMLTRLILTMLEGTPPSDVIASLINSIDWNLQRNIFRNYQLIVTEGKFLAQSEQEKSSNSPRTPGSPRKSQLLDYTDERVLPLKLRNAPWLLREAYKMVTYVQKLVIAVQGRRDVEDILRPMLPLLDDESLVRVLYLANP